METITKIEQFIMFAKSPISQEQAQNIAVKALGYLANEENYMHRFFALTGLDADQLRESAGEPSFLVGVLDFFLADEKSLVAFAEATSVNPEYVGIARQLLAGPENFEG